MAKIRAKGIKRIVYLCEKASQKDWDNYRNYLEQRLKQMDKERKKNQNQKIDADLREEMTHCIQKINKKLNVEIANCKERWSSEVLAARDKQNSSTYQRAFSLQFKEKINKNITKEKWEQAVSTMSNKLAPGASEISYTLIKIAGPFL
ncbi:36632_t:CDS:2 [Gigaspora margarita]|uniref:36632_t:CDS:1 n=1 Tax=Gigaspora margarita TaxID=4874 RepID=A0ABN7UVV6_GIGMA|nr:36632_t:CDS:2 [Gigaspora margarita]